MTLMRRGGEESRPKVGGHGDWKGGHGTFMRPLEGQLGEKPLHVV